MTEEQKTEPTVTEDKKDFVRRWGIVGLGVALATVVIAKAFSEDDDADEEETTVDVEVEYDPVTEEVTVEEV